LAVKVSDNGNVAEALKALTPATNPRQESTDDQAEACDGDPSWRSGHRTLYQLDKASEDCGSHARRNDLHPAGTEVAAVPAVMMSHRLTVEPRSTESWVEKPQWIHGRNTADPSRPNRRHGREDEQRDLPGVVRMCSAARSGRPESPTSSIYLRKHCPSPAANDAFGPGRND